MAEHNTTGKWGENLAREYLITKGYIIAETNWRLGHLEVDIIAFKANRVIFVEVKTRSTHAVDPLSAIDRRRVQHLVKAANTYVRMHDLPHEVQFDVILIIGHPDATHPPELEHIPDAFLAPLRTYR